MKVTWFRRRLIIKRLLSSKTTCDLASWLSAQIIMKSYQAYNLLLNQNRQVKNLSSHLLVKYKKHLLLAKQESYLRRLVASEPHTLPSLFSLQMQLPLSVLIKVQSNLLTVNCWQSFNNGSLHRQTFCLVYMVIMKVQSLIRSVSFH